MGRIAGKNNSAFLRFTLVVTSDLYEFYSQSMKWYDAISRKWIISAFSPSFPDLIA